MIELIERHRPAIEAICRNRHVLRLEVFGSATGRHFDPKRSDVDFLVEFVKDRPLDLVDAYFGLHEDLERLLGRPVDLVMTSAIKNPFFLESVNESRQTVYAA
ncbi:MAG TPA: nucleotidyltransferase domain-containing protein [Planctomycetota bacterium]|nr:nucleotidyltransferase domain-containing protein [Planctomycetota bacterium]